MIEVVISVALLAVLTMISFTVTFFASESFNDKVQLATLELKGERALKKFVEDISDGTTVSTLAVTTNNCIFTDGEIRFKVPVSFVDTTNANVALRNPSGVPVSITTQTSADNPTFPNDFKLNLIFGWRDDSTPVINLENNSLTLLQGPYLKVASVPVGMTLISGRTPSGEMAYRFVMNLSAPLGNNGIYDESVLRVDVDNDGAFTSVYAFGFLERYYRVDNDADGSAETEISDSIKIVADSNIILPIVLNGLSTTSDQTNMKTTRIFSRSGTQVDVHLFLLNVGTDGRPRVTHCTTTIFLRNS